MTFGSSSSVVHHGKIASATSELGQERPVGDVRCKSAFPNTRHIAASWQTSKWAKTDRERVQQNARLPRAKFTTRRASLLPHTNGGD